MKKSLGRRICVIGIGFICAFVLLNVILTYFMLIPFSTYLTSEQMKKIANEIQKQQLHMDEEFIEYIERANEDNNTQITVIDENKKVITTSKNSISYNHDIGRFYTMVFNENRDKLEEGKAVSVTKDKDMTNRIQVIVMKKIGEDRYVILSRSYRSLQNATKAAIMFNIISGIFIIVVGSIFVYRWSRYMIIPLRKMTNVAENISNMNFDAKVDVTSQDELGQLGISINKMSGYLEQNLEQLQDDIESRKRLVRNLSHEIKSPMAVIMGYADRMETMIDKNPEKALAYCKIISDESARVDNIVKEMLELSKMELGANEINKETLKIGTVFQHIKERFQEENMEKDIQYLEVYDEKEMVYADYILLERAVYNLIQNAVAHGDLQHMVIRVTGERKQDFYEIKVYNSGSHIDDAEINSIWEPFSKVDKVRTRGKQGHGVGLSIVREIVEVHEGYYAVQNIEQGIEFLIAIKG